MENKIEVQYVSAAELKECEYNARIWDPEDRAQLRNIAGGLYYALADLFRVSVSEIRRLQYGWQLPFIKVGGSVRFATSDLMAYLSKRRVESIG